jgi:hypothetical protein
MARETKKPNLPELIQAEVAPIKEQLNAKAEENARLLNENASLQQAVLAKGQETEALRRDHLDAIGKIRRSLLEKEIGRKRMQAVINEAKAVTAKARTSINSAREAAEKEKKAFVESVTNRLEKHVNEVAFSAFSAAKKNFDKDFTVLGESMLQEMGRLLSPYLSDKDITSKLQRLQEAMERSKQEAEFNRAQSEKRLGEIQARLNEATAEAAKAKMSLYKEQVCKSLPNSIKDKVLKEMEKANNVSDIKRIYMAALRESARVKTSDMVMNPVVDTAKSQKPEALRRPLNEANVPQATPQEQDINDPALLKLAGVED